MIENWADYVRAGVEAWSTMLKEGTCITDAEYKAILGVRRPLTPFGAIGEGVFWENKLIAVNRPHDPPAKRVDYSVYDREYARLTAGLGGGEDNVYVTWAAAREVQ